MPLDAFFKAVLLGLSIAAPVGPIGVLCIRRTLAHGRLHGLVSGLGAASADAVYGLIGGLGLTVVSAFLVNQQATLQLIGGAFLCVIGARTFLAKATSTMPGGANMAPSTFTESLASAYASTLMLTLTNPVTILSFAAMFAGMGASTDADGAGVAGVMALVAGVFAGSAAWWLMLSGLVGLLRNRISASAPPLTWINRISGGVILAFGLIALFGARIGA
jgi:threonine/homoserine/homoserine lactone efflux protein